MKIKLT